MDGHGDIEKEGVLAGVFEIQDRDQLAISHMRDVRQTGDIDCRILLRRGQSARTPLWVFSEFTFFLQARLQIRGKMFL